MQTFSGAWPAMVTPFTSDNEVDVAAINALVDYLLDQSVAGFYVCGSTGQGIYQTVAERKLVTETAIKRVDGRVPVIVHVGCQALPDAIELAKHAQRQGANGVSSIIPAGFTTLDSISRFYAAIAAAVPETPFLPYLFTSSSSAVELINSVSHVPNLAGAKYTGPNMYELRQIIEEKEAPWSIFSGMDEQCVYAAMEGSCGNIGSTLNVIPGAYRRMHESVAAGDIRQAQELQTQANLIIATLFSFGYIGALYAAIGMLGVAVGAPRLPVLPLESNRAAALRESLEASSFFELASL